jgi:hypothetical protein
LRLQPSLLDELRKVAEAEGVALNQLINVAVAEKYPLCVPRIISVSAPATLMAISKSPASCNVPWYVSTTT